MAGSDNYDFERSLADIAADVLGLNFEDNPVQKSHTGVKGLLTLATGCRLVDEDGQKKAMVPEIAIRTFKYFWVQRTPDQRCFNMNQDSPTIKSSQSGCCGSCCSVICGLVREDEKNQGLLPALEKWIPRFIARSSSPAVNRHEVVAQPSIVSDVVAQLSIVSDCTK